MKNVTYKILLILLTLAIVGEVAGIVLWTVNPPMGSEPEARFSLAVDWVFAVANAAVMIPLNLIAFYGIFKRLKWGPLFLIAISIGNRIASHPLFIGGVHGIFITWTAILVIVAYLDYRSLAKIKN